MSCDGFEAAGVEADARFVAGEGVDAKVAGLACFDGETVSGQLATHKQVHPRLAEEADEPMKQAVTPIEESPSTPPEADTPPESEVDTGELRHVGDHLALQQPVVVWARRLGEREKAGGRREAGEREGREERGKRK